MPLLTEDMAHIRNLVIDLGYEREQNRKEADRIADSIRELLAKADAAGMSRSEFARLLGIDRSNLYKVYVNDS